jgi:nucleoside-diphosphate-sugar epimerase
LICPIYWRVTLLKSNELIVISGGTGWIGRSLVSEIITTQHCPIEQIVLISSQSKGIEIANQVIKTITWENLALDSPVSLYFDLAFQTQEKILTIGKEKYIKENEKIIENSVNFIKLYKPQSIFLASTGAVYGKNYTSDPKPLNTYGQLKLKQELRISRISAEENLNLIISRVFNLSGSNINKYQTFAIAQFINSAIDQKFIKVIADHQVFRRYADVNQLIRLILKLMNSRVNCVFDSGGPLIELRDLALRIKNVLDPSIRLEHNVINENIPVDDYYSRFNHYEDLLKKHLNEVPINIEDQITNTFNYIKGFKN